MGMNVRINFLVDNKLLDVLRSEAIERGMNISELCRERLREGDQFEKMVERLEKIEGILEKR